MRIGRHSGAESITIEGRRDIKIKGKETVYSDKATTLWLASEFKKSEIKKDFKTFGWVELCEIKEAQAYEFLQKELSFKKQEEFELKKEQEKFEKQKKRQIQQKEEAERRALSEKIKRQEEERRRAELEAMSPEERDIATLSDPSIIEQRVVEIYAKIDNFSLKNKKVLALALKKYWESHNKWKKKDCAHKQWIKVQKVKGILGENG